MKKESSSPGKEMIGICGIFCGTCPRYLAPRIQDDKYLQTASQETGLPLEDLRCDGCLSEKVFPSCVDCRHGFRRCARDRQVTWCFQCPDFPCQRLRDFQDIHVVNGISHHAKLIEELRFMKEKGIEPWLAQKDQEGRCPQCGRMLYWYDLQCPSCHHSIPRDRISHGKS